MKFLDFLWIMLFIGMLIYGIESYFSTPVVHWSSSSNECVKVTHDGIERDCSELPEKFFKVWVK